MDIIMNIKDGTRAAKMPLIFLIVISIPLVATIFFPSLLMLSCFLVPLSALAFIAIGHFGAKGGASLSDILSVSVLSSIIIAVVAFIITFKGSLSANMYSLINMGMEIGYAIVCILLSIFGYFMGSIFKKKDDKK